MMSLNVPELTELVQEYFQEHASRLNLRAEQVQVEYMLNWGGFVNYSFTISDREKSLHLKLAHEPEPLRRWERLHKILEERYHAPELIAWVDLPAANYAGLLFRHVVGQHVNFTQSLDLLREIIAITDKLHADRELAEQLKVLDGERSYLDSFVGTYIERFDADLEIIESDLPPFVSQETFRWMQQETRKLEALAHDSPAFALRAQSPIHGDLYDNNILVTDQKRWFLLDWDDLALGDPALDYAMLLRNALSQNKRLPWQDFLGARDIYFAQRMELYLRAGLLDQVIDVLADYVECAVAPEHRERVQEQKRREHVEALSRYRKIYGAEKQLRT